ncbi:MAG: chemotaxis protein CheA, partial [Phycisphaerales bacterium]
MTDLGGFSMHELFRAEVETHCAALSDGLLGLEGAPEDLGIIVPLMRAAHSVKGAARIVGIDAAVTVAHHMEDVLVHMQKGQERATRGRIDQLLEGTDFLLRISKVAEHEIPEWSAAHAGEVNAITTALAAPPPSTAPPVPVARQESPRRVDAVVQRPMPAAEAAPQPAPATAAPEARSVRVNADNLDRMMRLAGESMVEGRRSPGLRQALGAVRTDMVRAREALEAATRRGGAARIDAAREALDRAERALADRLAELERFFRRTEEVSTALYHEVIGSRMRPFGEGVAGFPRMVRDLAKDLGKRVRFDIVGTDVPVDRDILSRLEAPLNHILRNAVDHGIEMPTERLSAGKPEQARLLLEARHHAGQLLVRVSEDGRGIDPARIRAKVVERGLQAADVVARLGERELFDFLFLPGFSTAKQVTEISGRGVGLDVVHQAVMATGGSVRVESRLGAGTTFALQLPVTLSVVRAALVEVAGEPYAFPLSRIDCVLRADVDRISSVQGRLQCDVDGEATGLVDAATLLGLGESARGDSTSVVVLGDEGGRVGVVVSRFLGEEDRVVRTLDPRLGTEEEVEELALAEARD